MVNRDPKYSWVYQELTKDFGDDFDEEWNIDLPVVFNFKGKSAVEIHNALASEIYNIVNVVK